MSIIKAILLLGGLGLIFGAILAYASKKFAVEVDEKEENILAVLPGANCGGCGFAGCGGLAAAIAKGEAPVNGCPVGGATVAAKVGEIMGVAVGSGERIVAAVKCKGTCGKAKDKYEHQGLKDCRAASVLIGGPKACSSGCLGYGTCVSVCKFDAIKIEDGVAVVDEDKCVLCGKCIDICPKALITKKPASKEVFVKCNSHEFGKAVKQNCSAGCIGCGACAKVCPVEAITMDNKLAIVDQEKCIGCKVCVEKCPTKVIEGDISDRRKVSIDEEKCIGCTMCARQCKFGAIEGEKKQPHKIDLDKCKGCHLCLPKCKKGAMNLIDETQKATN
ncbi:MAG: RnfABCDGE type electron transport complex subunit B [Terrisporobacter sp.]|uniref:RnfABCDGE type electron transport complex subunit B n=1 Tax=Terrisporobacter sp. TaxID=1965305 RepID=UPI002FC8FAFF